MKNQGTKREREKGVDIYAAQNLPNDECLKTEFGNEVKEGCGGAKNKIDA